MKVFRKIDHQRDFSTKCRINDKTIGFVPTMGYLHRGHLSLLDKSFQKTDITVVSIFVNPTQFGPDEDLNKYPRDEKRDLEILRDRGVDAVFIPEKEEIYPPNFQTFVEVKKLSKGFCGKSRPTHFRGVTTIVLKLFNIVQPHIAVFGEKDFQQYIIIKQMTRDLNLPIRIISSPIIREEDGLAMSSRNNYLTPEQRKEATVLFNSMQRVRNMVENGERNVSKLKSIIENMIGEKKHARIDYISFVEPETLKKVSIVEKSVRILMAVWIGRARLIDNMEINPGYDSDY